MSTGYSATEPDEEELDEPLTDARAGVDLKKIAQGVRLILEGIGEDVEREGLRRTPQRVAEMYAELSAGMREDPHEHVVPLPGDKNDERVIVKDIHIASLCEHHLAPCVRRCHIADTRRSDGVDSRQRIVAQS